MDLPAGLFARLAEGEEELLAVKIVLEDGLAMIPTIHHMVDGTGIFDAQLAGHDCGVTNTLRLCQC